MFSGENLTVYWDGPGIKYLLLINTVFWLLPMANWNTLISKIKPWFLQAIRFALSLCDFMS